MTNNAQIHNLLREEGVAASDSSVDDLWKAYALQAIQLLATHRRRPFSSDDVWEILDAWGLERPQTPSAMGPVFRRAASLGFIQNTGTFIESKQVSNHRKVTLWSPSSLL